MLSFFEQDNVDSKKLNLIISDDPEKIKKLEDGPQTAKLKKKLKNGFIFSQDIDDEYNYFFKQQPVENLHIYTIFISFNFFLYYKNNKYVFLNR